LRFYDVATATYIAVSINIAVALMSMFIAKAIPYAPAKVLSNVPPNEFASDSAPNASQNAWTVYTTIALSGMTALAAGVVWTRQLSLMFGATVYAFSLILAVFLVGLGIGAAIGSAIARNTANAPLAPRA